MNCGFACQAELGANGDWAIRPDAWNLGQVAELAALNRADPTEAHAVRAAMFQQVANVANRRSGHLDAALEHRQVVPAVLVLADQRAAGVQNPALDHQVVEQAELLDQQAVGVPPGPIRILLSAADRGQGAVEEGRGDGGIAEHLQADAAGKSDLVDRADIGAGATERRQVGDDGLAASDMRLIAQGDPAPFRQMRPFRGSVGRSSSGDTPVRWKPAQIAFFRSSQAAASGRKTSGPAR